MILDAYDELRDAGRLVSRSLPSGEEIELVEKVARFKLRAFNPETREVEVVASDGNKDRYGDTIDPNGWKTDEYHKNPVILIDHEYNVGSIVGISVREYVSGDQFRQIQRLDDPALNPGAGKILNLLAAGSLRAVSVGFRALKWERQYEEDHFVGFHFQEQELLEVSWVAVPANPNAVIAQGMPVEREERTELHSRVLNQITARLVLGRLGG